MQRRASPPWTYYCRTGPGKQVHVVEGVSTLHALTKFTRLVQAMLRATPAQCEIAKSPLGPWTPWRVIVCTVHDAQFEKLGASK